jgi:hypothetical protein
MIFKAAEYGKSKRVFPDRESKDLDKNSEQYNLQIAEYVYSEFCRGGTYVGYDWYSDVDRNRKYSDGRQDTGIYMDAFYGKEQSNTVIENFDNANTRLAKRNAYATLNFEIQSPAPRYVDAIVNKLAELVNRVSVDASDRSSAELREELKWGTYVDGKFRNELESLRAMAGLPQQDIGYTPRSVEELNLYEAEGGFKLGYEEVMERLLKFAFEQSNWEENSLERHIKDLITSGFTGAEDYYDKHTGQVLTRYLDAEYVGVQYTKEDAYRKPDFGFYTRMVKLSDLYKRGLDEEKLDSAAKTFEGKYGNPTSDDLNKVNKQRSDYSKYDQYTVPVFVVKWIDVEWIREAQNKIRKGKVRTRNVDREYKPTTREQIIETRTKTLREVHWVIGTNLVYDYGKCEFQNRDGLNEPVLPIHLVKVTGTPIIPRIIPSLDQYQMAWLRLQQGISLAAMNGYAINMDAISNLSMGSKKMSPREVLRFWRQTGTLFFKPTDVAGNVHQGMITRPVEQLPGGAGAVINEALVMMDAAMQQIERLTGINDVAVGGAPDRGTGKAVTEFSIAGTNDVLKGILKQVNILKSDVARGMTMRLQHVIEADERARKAYSWIGDSAIELLKIANGGDVKYGIRTHVRPTQQDIAELKEMIALSLKNGRDGKVGITEADAVRFNAMINSGASLKRVALLLDFANKKAKEEAEAKEMRMIQINAQQQAYTAQVNSQGREQEQQIKTQSEIEVQNAKTKGSILEKAFEKGEVKWDQALYLISGRTVQEMQEPQQQQIGQTQEQTLPMPEEAV